MAGARRLLVRVVLAAAARRLAPALMLGWAALAWFVVNFGPILDFRALAREFAANPGLRVGLGAGWVAAWAWLPGAAARELLDGDLAFLQRQPLRAGARGLVLAAALLPAALPAALAGALWPGGPVAALGFAAAGAFGLAAFGRGRPAWALATSALPALVPGWALAAALPWALGLLAAAPARPARRTGGGLGLVPPGPLGALVYRELLVAVRGEAGAVAGTVLLAAPLGLLFRGFRAHSGWDEATLGQAAAVALIVAGVAAGSLAGRMVVRLGWPPVPRAWPLRPPARLVSLAVLVALGSLPTSVAFAAAGVPGSVSAALPVALGLLTTSVATAAAALWSRGRSLGALFGWTAAALVLTLVGGAPATSALVAVAGLFVWRGLRAAAAP